MEGNQPREKIEDKNEDKRVRKGEEDKIRKRRALMKVWKVKK